MLILLTPFFSIITTLFCLSFVLFFILFIITWLVVVVGVTSCYVWTHLICVWFNFLSVEMLIKKSSIVRLLLSWMIKLCHMFTYCQSEAHTHTYYDENTFRHLIVGSFMSWKKSLSIKSQSRHVIILGFLLFPCQSVNNNESVGPWLGKCVCAPVRRMSYGLRFHFTRFKCRLSGKERSYVYMISVNTSIAMHTIA